MSSSDMKFHKVLDERLNLGDQIDFAVYRGGANITPSQRVADSASVNSIQFNVDVPSLDTIVDRRIYIKTKWQVEVEVNNGTNIQFANNVCLRSFPFHSMVNTIQLTTNSATTSINMQDWLPVLERMFENEDLGYYQSGCPVYPDYYSKYADAGATLGSKTPFLGYSDGEYNHLLKRGAFDVESVAKVGDVYTITFTSYEPVLISPLVYKACRENFPGAFGINTFNLTYNLLSANLGRCLSVNNADVIRTTVINCQEATLFMNFITPPADLILPSQSIVPFYQLQSYIADSSANLAQNVLQGQSIGKTLTLNQIPDYVYVWLRDASADANTANRFAPITSIKINFNNNDGLLSSAQTLDLYHYSVECGLNQNWQEFSGEAVQSFTTAGVKTVAKTCGGPVVLQFGKHIQIPQGFLAPGSIGQYNIQITVNYKNPNPLSGGNTPTFNGQLMVGVVNVGLMVNSKGSTSYFTGPLDKVAVLQANDLPLSHEMYRMLGAGNFMDNLKTVIQKASKEVAKMPEVKQMAQQDNAMGQGRSAGGRSAGAMKYRLK